MKYEFHLAAQDEHLGNVSYYESIRAGLGARYLADFESTAERICATPSRFRLERVPNIHTASLLTFPYFVIYREIDGKAQVLAVLHFRRRPGYWAARL